ncbi:MAG: nucleotidyltransferase domain-containing protein [bacterium]
MVPYDIKKKIKMLIVFGSRIKGAETNDSDLDILRVVYEKSKKYVNCLITLVFI